MRFKTGSSKGVRSPMKIVAVLLSVLAAISLYYTFNQIYVTVPVVVATKNISVMQEITDADVAVVEVAQRDRHPQAFSDPNEVVKAYSSTAIFKGQQLIAPQITRDLDKMVSEVLEVDETETFIHLSTRNASWPPVLSSGDLVTVIGNYEDGIRDIAVAKVVAANKESIISDFAAIRDANVKPTGDDMVLAVKVEDAKTILRAVDEAKSIYLLPRNPALGGM